ncbi:caspase family protein, partial [Stenotrophomonas maltophilia]|uniref:caspase family protein n=1 Tax=Stenotrophomonas maltophilia TaxID=40324 RepID=UPI0034DACA29
DIRGRKDKVARAKEGDTVYIFFSGHGDADNNSEAIFLLCNDAVRGNYENEGVINIGLLKTSIKTMQNNGVQVILIMDACRINELAKKSNSQVYEKIMDVNSGEIQMTSCSQNEKSWEDARWGHGHGVFT